MVDSPLRVCDQGFIGIWPQRHSLHHRSAVFAFALFLIANRVNARLTPDPVPGARQCPLTRLIDASEAARSSAKPVSTAAAKPARRTSTSSRAERPAPRALSLNTGPPPATVRVAG